MTKGEFLLWRGQVFQAIELMKEGLIPMNLFLQEITLNNSPVPESMVTETKALFIKLRDEIQRTVLEHSSSMRFHHFELLPMLRRNKVTPSFSFRDFFNNKWDVYVMRFQNNEASSGGSVMVIAETATVYIHNSFIEHYDYQLNEAELTMAITNDINNLVRQDAITHND